jgi:alkylglycerol monooxygenase
MDISPIVLSIPIYFLLIGIELLVERFSHTPLYRLNDAVTNISCGITSQLTGVFLKIFTFGIYVFLFEHFRLFTLPTIWYTWILLFFLVDLGYYWAHRMSHEINLFWGGHVVHHQSEDYNFSVALRQSSFQVIWTFAFFLPLAFIGFNPTDFLLVSALNTVYQFWIHTETIGKLGFLEKFLNTPSHHRVHHGRDPKYIDKNHAGVFIIWDKMFGTFQEEEERPTYGITTPVNSWNPVWVNISHYADMYQKWGQIKGWKNKVKFLLKKPGWLPEEMGGYQAPPEVDKAHYRKYHPHYARQVSYYVLFQYLLALGATAWFLFQQDGFETYQQVGIVAAITWTVVNCGALFETKRWVIAMEFLRIVSFAAGGLGAGWLLDLPLLLAGSLAYGIVSIGWMAYLHKTSGSTPQLEVSK